MVCSKILIFLDFDKSIRDGTMDGPMDRPTDQQIDQQALVYRYARMDLKSLSN